MFRPDEEEKMERYWGLHGLGEEDTQGREMGELVLPESAMGMESPGEDRGESADLGYASPELRTAGFPLPGSSPDKGRWVYR